MCHVHTKTRPFAQCRVCPWALRRSGAIESTCKGTDRRTRGGGGLVHAYVDRFTRLSRGKQRQLPGLNGPKRPPELGHTTTPTTDAAEQCAHTGPRPNPNFNLNPLQARPGPFPAQNAVASTFLSSMAMEGCANIVAIWNAMFSHFTTFPATQRCLLARGLGETGMRCGTWRVGVGQGSIKRGGGG